MVVNYHRAGVVGLSSGPLLRLSGAEGAMHLMRVIKYPPTFPLSQLDRGSASTAGEKTTARADPCKGKERA